MSSEDAFIIIDGALYPLDASAEAPSIKRKNPSGIGARAAVLFPIAAVAVWLAAVGTGRAEPAETLAVVLVCPTSVEAADCSRDTALDVRVLPAPGPLACMLGAQMTMAREGAAGLGRYGKVVCERRKG